jgi:hypothetical protein
MAQYCQGATLDVVRGDELTPAQQGAGTRPAYQVNGRPWAGADG